MGTGCMRVPEKDFRNKSFRKPKNNPVVSLKTTRTARRKSIFTRREDFYVEASAAEMMPNVIKSTEDVEKILTALNSHFIFTSLTDEDKEMVANSMQLYSFQADTIVFLQGMPSKSYYVIRTGSIEVIVNGKKVNKITEGDGFGELALLHDNPRSATLKCSEETTLWGLDRETFKKVIEEMNIQIYEQNRAFLEKVSLLDHLTMEQKDWLAASLVCHKYFCGQKIITEGETGNQLFFIKEGVVSVIKSNQEVRRMYPGAYFGESALINNTPRTATCVAVEGSVKCMCLTRETLQKTLNNKLQDIIEKNTISEAMKKSSRLCLLNKDQKDEIAKNILEKNYKAGDIVIGIGNVCSAKLFFLMSGRLQYAKNALLFSDKGSVVGDLYVTRSNNDEIKYEDDLIAGCDMKIGEITKYHFESAIGGRFEEVIKENSASNVLRKIQIFSSIDYDQVKELLSYIVIEKRNDSEIILREGIYSNSVYVVKRGKIDEIRAGALIRTIGKFGYFGERTMVLEEPSKNTYAANGYVTLWSVRTIDLRKVMNEKMKTQLLNKIRMEEEDTELYDLKILKPIGQGSFSKVYLVRTPKKDLYALKITSREKIKKLVLYEQLIHEKIILNQLDHPFIMKFVKSYKDSKRIYFLLEYIQGYDLSIIMRHIGLFTNADSIFYSASLLLVLEYLHSRDILYRDLKPENVIIDSEGFVKLIDFGTAKVIQGRTYTLVGTPYYVAPEVIVGRGYGKSADLWSLGIMIYEFMCGKVPFGHSEEDPYRIYEAILKNSLEIAYDIPPLTDHAQSLLKKLLNKYSTSRQSETVERIKCHEWYNNVDWEDLYSKNLVPPYRPTVKPIDEDSDESDQDHEWDLAIDTESDNNSIDESEILTEEIKEYLSTIPHNWDKHFI